MNEQPDLASIALKTFNEECERIAKIEGEGERAIEIKKVHPKIKAFFKEPDIKRYVASIRKAGGRR